MNEIDELDTYQTDTPVCPHCGFTSVDLEGFVDETSGTDQCTECGKWYTWDSEYTVAFFTRKIDWLEAWKNYNRGQIQCFEAGQAILKNHSEIQMYVA